MICQIIDCTEIKNDREKYILADEELLNDIGPLIKELSRLKCVDSYDATKAAAGAATGTIGFVQVDANVAAQCAMYMYCIWSGTAKSK